MELGMNCWKKIYHKHNQGDLKALRYKQKNPLKHQIHVRKMYLKYVKLDGTGEKNKRV